MRGLLHGLFVLLMLTETKPVAAADESAQIATADQLAFFEAKIRPVLVKHCYQCHSSESKIVQGGLRLDSRAGLTRGGDSGPAVSPATADSSLLLQALRYDGLQMPPAGRLPDSVIQDFQTWLSMGAPDPRTESSPAPAAPADPEAGRNHWAFQVPRESPIPATTTPVTSRLDALILAKLQEQQ
ncbi:MAG: c-type cytochrome domain-containing protein, partial [Planctomycetaceae bacterium]